MSCGVRLTYDLVKKFFDNNKCELLSSEYKNARSKLKYRCVCGNISEIVFDSFRRGNRCKSCGSKRCGLKQRYSHDKVAEYFKSQGCELLDVYVKSSLPMRYRCVCGNESKINYNNFMKGRRCKLCHVKKISGENNYQWIKDRKSYSEWCNFRFRCYNALRNSLKAFGNIKNKKTEELLGYTCKDLQSHIKSHPNWKMCADKKWCIDHIFPISAFKEYGISDPTIINCLENLQPLIRDDNLIKTDKYDRSLFEKWLISKNIDIGVQICI